MKTSTKMIIWMPTMLFFHIVKKVDLRMQQILRSIHQGIQQRILWKLVHKIAHCVHLCPHVQLKGFCLRDLLDYSQLVPMCSLVRREELRFDEHPPYSWRFIEFSFAG